MASSLVGHAELPSKDDSWVVSILQQNVEDYQTFSKRTPVMPKLAIKGSMMMQGTARGSKGLEAELKKHLSLR